MKRNTGRSPMLVDTKPRFESFAEYLAYDDGTENLYELFNGELVALPPESGENVQIANRLFLFFALLIGTDRVRCQGLELEVRGEPRNRYPDLSIIREDHIEQLQRRNTLRLIMAPPLLVVEVVSPGDLQRDRDYVAKRSQYQDREIPEYWIVDPQVQTILVLTLQEGQYIELGTFAGAERIRSLQFEELNLTVEQVLRSPQ